MQTPSEPQQAGVPTTAIPASSSMGDGGPGATYKYLLTLMENPAVKSQVITSRALARAPFAAEEPSREGTVPSPEPPPAVPSTPPATGIVPLPPPAESEEVAQTPPPADLALPPKEEARRQELTPPTAYRMETAAINLGVQTSPPSDSLRSKEEQLLAKKFYRIGPEDVIRVSVWENPELTMDVTVRPDGKISLPLIKEIHAADLTPMELSVVITQNLQEYIKGPHVTVILTQTNSPKIYLVGNVLRPGAYALRNDMTVLQALSLAGGFTPFASPRNMKLISGTGTRQEIRNMNFYKMIEDIELDYHMLKPGDTIVIP
jgi:polysaccharide export outer membrane protein